MAHRTLLAETGVQLAAETQGIEADCLAEDALHLGVQISPEGDATVLHVFAKYLMRWHLLEVMHKYSHTCSK